MLLSFIPQITKTEALLKDRTLVFLPEDYVQATLQSPNKPDTNAVITSASSVEDKILLTVKKDNGPDILSYDNMMNMARSLDAKTALLLLQTIEKYAELSEKRGLTEMRIMEATKDGAAIRFDDKTVIAHLIDGGENHTENHYAYSVTAEIGSVLQENGRPVARLKAKEPLSVRFAYPAQDNTVTVPLQYLNAADIESIGQAAGLDKSLEIQKPKEKAAATAKRGL